MAILNFLAQATTTTTTQSAVAPTTAPWWFPTGNGQFIPLIGMVAIFYYVMIRSKKKRDAAKKDQLDTLKRGDEVQTIGGIIGTVVEARENEVILKVDETNNTKMKFSRNAIHRVLEPKTKDAK